MDENEQRYENYYHQDCFLCNHPFLRHFLTWLFTLLGAFLAFYFVTDWHYKRMLDPVVQMRKMDKIMQREEHQMHKWSNREMKREAKLEQKAGQIIKIEKNDENYKIVINLKPFDNNEKNVEVSTEGKTLTINAAGETKKHNKDTIVRISQSFIFPEEANLSEISKFKEGNNYIVIVPIGVD